MTANIRNDFPIETATKFYSEAEAKDELIGVAKTEGKKKKEDLCRFMLLMADQLDDRDLDERVEQELGKAAKIKMQRGLGLQLSQEDIDYIISRL
jgi:ribosomal 50S subunit-associated protein YjgA (DUF615 family)